MTVISFKETMLSQLVGNSTNFNLKEENDEREMEENVTKRYERKFMPIVKGSANWKGYKGENKRGRNTNVKKHFSYVNRSTRVHKKSCVESIGHKTYNVSFQQEQLWREQPCLIEKFSEIGQSNEDMVSDTSSLYEPQKRDVYTSKSFEGHASNNEADIHQDENDVFVFSASTEDNSANLLLKFTNCNNYQNRYNKSFCCNKGITSSQEVSTSLIDTNSEHEDATDSQSACNSDTLNSSKKFFVDIASSSEICVDNLSVRSDTTSNREDLCENSLSGMPIHTTDEVFDRKANNINMIPEQNILRFQHASRNVGTIQNIAGNVLKEIVSTKKQIAYLSSNVKSERQRYLSDECIQIRTSDETILKGEQNEKDIETSPVSSEHTLGIDLQEQTEEVYALSSESISSAKSATSVGTLTSRHLSKNSEENEKLSYDDATCFQEKSILFSRDTAIRKHSIDSSVHSIKKFPSCPSLSLEDQVSNHDQIQVAEAANNHLHCDTSSENDASLEKHSVSNTSVSTPDDTWLLDYKMLDQRSWLKRSFSTQEETDQEDDNSEILSYISEQGPHSSLSGMQYGYIKPCKFPKMADESLQSSYGEICESTDNDTPSTTKDLASEPKFTITQPSEQVNQENTDMCMCKKNSSRDSRMNLSLKENIEDARSFGVSTDNGWETSLDQDRYYFSLPNIGEETKVNEEYQYHQSKAEAEITQGKLTSVSLKSYTLTQHPAINEAIVTGTGELVQEDDKLSEECNDSVEETLVKTGNFNSNVKRKIHGEHELPTERKRTENEPERKRSDMNIVYSPRQQIPLTILQVINSLRDCVEMEQHTDSVFSTSERMQNIQVQVILQDGTTSKIKRSTEIKILASPEMFQDRVQYSSSVLSSPVSGNTYSDCNRMNETSENFSSSECVSEDSPLKLLNTTNYPEVIKYRTSTEELESNKELPNHDCTQYSELSSSISTQAEQVSNLNSKKLKNFQCTLQESTPANQYADKYNTRGKLSLKFTQKKLKLSSKYRKPNKVKRLLRYGIHVAQEYTSRNLEHIPLYINNTSEDSSMRNKLASNKENSKITSAPFSTNKHHESDFNNKTRTIENINQISSDNFVLKNKYLQSASENYESDINVSAPRASAYSMNFSKHNVIRCEAGKPNISLPGNPIVSLTHNKSNEGDRLDAQTNKSSISTYIPYAGKDFDPSKLEEYFKKDADSKNTQVTCKHSASLSIFSTKDNCAVKQATITRDRNKKERRLLKVREHPLVEESEDNQTSFCSSYSATCNRDGDIANGNSTQDQETENVERNSSKVHADYNSHSSMFRTQTNHDRAHSGSTAVGAEKLEFSITRTFVNGGCVSTEDSNTNHNSDPHNCQSISENRGLHSHIEDSKNEPTITLIIDHDFLLNCPKRDENKHKHLEEETDMIELKEIAHTSPIYSLTSCNQEPTMQNELKHLPFENKDNDVYHIISSQHINDTSTEREFSSDVKSCGMLSHDGHSKYMHYTPREMTEEAVKSSSFQDTGGEAVEKEHNAEEKRTELTEQRDTFQTHAKRLSQRPHVDTDMLVNNESVLTSETKEENGNAGNVSASTPGKRKNSGISKKPLPIRVMRNAVQVVRTIIRRKDIKRPLPFSVSEGGILSERKGKTEKVSASEIVVGSALHPSSFKSGIPPEATISNNKEEKSMSNMCSLDTKKENIEKGNPSCNQTPASIRNDKLSHEDPSGTKVISNTSEPDREAKLSSTDANEILNRSEGHNCVSNGPGRKRIIKSKLTLPTSLFRQATSAIRTIVSKGRLRETSEASTHSERVFQQSRSEHHNGVEDRSQSLSANQGESGKESNMPTEDEKEIHKYLHKVLVEKFNNQEYELIIRPKCKDRSTKNEKQETTMSTDMNVKISDDEAKATKTESPEPLDEVPSGERHVHFADEQDSSLLTEALSKLPAVKERPPHTLSPATLAAMSKELSRGFRIDNMALGGDLCLNVSPDVKKDPHVAEDEILFSDNDNPIDFLVKAGYTIDEATRGMADDRIRRRMRAAITEANVWVNSLKKSQVAMLYVLAIKSKHKTMRYYLFLVEAIVHNRIMNVVKLDAYLQLIYQIETGVLKLSNTMGIKDEESLSDEIKIAQEQEEKVFKQMSEKAQKECMQEFGEELNAQQVHVLHALANGYNPRLAVHEDLLAHYIGCRIITSCVAIDAAVTFLSREEGPIKLQEFEIFCGIMEDHKSIKED